MRLWNQANSGCAAALLNSGETCAVCHAGSALPYTVQAPDWKQHAPHHSMTAWAACKDTPMLVGCSNTSLQPVLTHCEHSRFNRYYLKKDCSQPSSAALKSLKRAARCLSYQRTSQKPSTPHPLNHKLSGVCLNHDSAGQAKPRHA